MKHGRIQIPIAHVHLERENWTGLCACVLQENLHSIPIRSHIKSYIPCTVTKSIVSNTCGRAIPIRVKFATGAVVLSSARLWLVLQNSLSRLESLSSHTCYTSYFYAQGPLFCALVREEAIFVVCKWCANEGFMRVYIYIYIISNYTWRKIFFFTHARKTATKKKIYIYI